MNCTDCFFYEEYEDMNARVPYCNCFKTDMECDNCKFYIEREEAIELVKERVEKDDKRGIVDNSAQSTKQFVEMLQNTRLGYVVYQNEISFKENEQGVVEGMFEPNICGLLVSFESNETNRAFMKGIFIKSGTLETGDGKKVYIGDDVKESQKAFIDYKIETTQDTLNIWRKAKERLDNDT